MSNEYYQVYSYQEYAREKVFRVVYLCAACKQYEHFFSLHFADDYVMKAGQYPPWEITPDKNLSELLGEHQDYYKKGLVCESQGYGIGAYAYYRRIVEEIIDSLLDSIVDLIPEGEKQRYVEALERTKKATIAQKKIDLVKDLLPEILRPNGMNPLNILHSTLSEGLHDKTDEECLEIVGSVREILVFLVNRILQTRQTSKKFTISMQKLLEPIPKSQFLG
jgi:predicted house-cleaning noncanonical NTP pyrophosphatase (MazG superfamily)